MAVFLPHAFTFMPKSIYMSRIKSSMLCLFLLATHFCFAQDTTQHHVTGRVNAPGQATKHYVILISADGFRYDLADKYHAGTLLQLRDKGIKAEYLQSSFPSLTFPNHYSIATGLYPAHHGLVDNSMYDPARNRTYTIGNRKEVADSTWYGGTPIWVLAEQQRLLTASFYWVGSETAVKGIRPTYYYSYNDKINIDTRIGEVKKWLQLPEDQRPHLITFYFPEVDHAEHRYGPDSKETEEAVHFVDESIKKMTDTLATLGLAIDYIFVSDHGMAAVDVKNPLSLPAAVDTSKFKVMGGSSLLHLYARNAADIQPTYARLKKDAKDYDVYLATETPATWHYSKDDDTYNRIGDILLVPQLPRVFSLGRYPPQIGNHGFDPALTDMHATFYAWGPDFKSNLEIPHFENVHIYPLIAKMLGLEYSFDIDGNVHVLEGILR